MRGKVFIDTNFLIYLFSDDESLKREKCEFLISDKLLDNIIVWSTQVIQEFYSVLTRKLGKEPLQVKKSIMTLKDFQLVTNDYNIILSAVDIQVLNNLTFWDSLILAAAASSNCSFLLSEDLNHGQIINGVKILNPFEL